MLSCLYENESLYIDEENQNCYKSCSNTNNGKIYIYQNKCVSLCPENYISDENNICKLEFFENESTDAGKFEDTEKLFDEKDNIFDLFDKLNKYSYNNINIDYLIIFLNYINIKY